jgi:methyl-accepting chemotaxis protein
MQDIAASSETFQLEGRDRAVVDNLNTIMQTYFRSAAQAIEMATVDTRLARKYMVSANRSYQRVNEVLGELVGSSRSDTGNAISLARDGIGYHSLQVGIILVGAVSLIALLGWATSRTLVLDLNGIKQKLTSLAAGDTRGDLMPAKRSGEIGEMIEALEVFRQNVIEVARVNKALQDRERDMRLAKEQAELDKKNALDELRTVVEEKAQREIDMVHSQKLESLGTLAGGVAHEINTPIQYIGNNLEFL